MPPPLPSRTAVQPRSVQCAPDRPRWSERLYVVLLQQTCALEFKRTIKAEIRDGLVVSQRFDPEHGPQHGLAGVVVDAVQSERPANVRE